MPAPRTSSARQRRTNLPALILSQIRDSVIATDLEARVIFWNQGATDIFGYQSAEIVGTPIARLFTTQDLHKLKSNLAQILAGKDFDGEWEAVRKDGQRIWLHSRRTLFKDVKGHPIGFLGLSREITLQKKEAETVRQSEQLYRAVGQSIDFGVWSCDQKGRLTHLSESFMKFLGLTPAQSLSDGWLNALHPEEREGIMNAWNICFANGQPWSRRYRIRGADGAYHEVLTRAAPVRDEKGIILCWAGLNLDVSQLSD
jgi:PAS domain S-box-containing protein